MRTLRIARRLIEFLSTLPRSRLGWILASLHALWFVLAVANMSPPSPRLAEYLDKGGWSSATLFAGRPFHYTYESLVLKFLLLADLPALVVFGLLSTVFSLWNVIGACAASYVDALLLLIGASCQWLIIGRLLTPWLISRKPGAWVVRRADSYFVFIISAIMIIMATLAPLVNERSAKLGFRHGGISFGGGTRSQQR